MIFNFGSINIDHVYRVHEFPRPGETLNAISHEEFLGGKGVNQSVAIARAGANVRHVGAVGQDGNWALTLIQQMGVSTDHIVKLIGPSGHAIIFVDDSGENEIVIAGAANQQLSVQQIEEALEEYNAETDWVLLQNETNLAEEIVDHAKAKGLKVAYAAAPFVAETTLSLLDRIDLLAVNEGEAASLATALNCEPEDIPVPQLLVTRGSKGADFIQGKSTLSQAAFAVEPVDTTGAGDTFLGSFLARLSLGEGPDVALRYASAASALQVTREGAAVAIPAQEEVFEFLEKQD